MEPETEPANEPVAPMRRASRARGVRVGLSGKLLFLTILFVMVAEILIYVPSIANFRLNWLNDRLAAAHTAALVLDAAPSGMVPESLAKQILQQHRRARGGDEDGQPAPAARRHQYAVQDRRRTSTCATCRGGAPSSTHSRRCCSASRAT